jgi:hypothetical protein
MGTALLFIALFAAPFVLPAIITAPLVRYARRRKERLEARLRVGLLASQPALEVECPTCGVPSPVPCDSTGWCHQSRLVAHARHEIDRVRARLDR